MTPFIDRMIRAAKLDINLYEEVEADEKALGQATGVVVLSSIAGGVGLIESGGVGLIVVGTILALTRWYIWAFLTYYIGTRFLPEPQTQSSHGELLRTIGFSSAPGLIRVFAIVPSLANTVFLIAEIWMLVAMVIAVRQALDYHSTLRAVGVCIIGWVVQAVIVGLALTMLGGLPEPPLEEVPLQGIS